MSWEAIGAVGEVFGGLAVLATLFYFSIQIRQSNKLAEAQSQRELLNFNVFTPLVENPTLTTEFRACLNRYEEQNADVKTRFNFLMINWHLQMESVFRMHEQGLYAEFSYKGYLSWYNSLLNTPGGSIWWNDMSGSTAPDFEAALEELRNDPNNPYQYSTAFDIMPCLEEEQ